MRVLAAMSGGVDSAVAAARAVDAGHDVTGVHLALSRTRRRYRTGARGCCTLEDSHDARRAADVHRHPVLRLGYGRAVPRRRRRGLRRRVHGRPHAQPVPALQREDQVRGRAGSGAGAGLRRRRAPATTPGSAADGRAAPRVDDGQGPVVCAGRADAASSSRTRCSRSAAPKAAGARRGRRARVWPSPTSPTAHDICFIADGDTRASSPSSWARQPGRHRGRRRRGARPPRRGLRATRSGQRKGWPRRAGADGKPRYVLSITPVTNTVTVGPAEALDIDTVTAERPIILSRPGRPDRVPGAVARTRCRATTRWWRSWAAGSRVFASTRRRGGRRAGDRGLPPRRGPRPARRSPARVNDHAGARQRAPASAACPAPTSARRSGSRSASCRCRTCPSCRSAGSGCGHDRPWCRSAGRVSGRALHRTVAGRRAGRDRLSAYP